MGYNTYYTGAFKFNKKLKSSDMTYLKNILQIGDYRKLNETLDKQYVNEYLTFLNLELTEDESGLQWDECEKSHDMDSALNLITILMRRRNSEFKLIGEMLAQGEYSGDTFKIIIDKQGFTEIVKLDDSYQYIPECTWDLTQINERDGYKVGSSCGETIELDYTLIREFTYCPFCSVKIDKKWHNWR